MEAEIRSPRTPNQASAKARTALHNWLDAIIAILLVLVYLLGYRFISGTTSGHEEEARAATQRPVLQIEVLNGSGVNGAAARCADLLRSQGFDVVAIANYESFDIPETIVLDRRGNEAVARHVAQALGVAPDNQLVQLNPARYVDASVILGRDYARLSLPQQYRSTH